jgi:cytochrome P450
MKLREPLNADVFNKPETWADPYGAYRQFREHSPVRCELSFVSLGGDEASFPAWMLLKHDQVFAALRDHATFSSENPAAGTVAPKLVLIQDDPPRHQRFRRLVNRAFTPKRIAELEPWITKVANELIDQFQNNLDLMKAYAIPLPVRVIARLLGIPAEDYLKFKQWSDAFLAFATRDMDPSDRARSAMEMMRYFGEMAAARRSHGAEDLITALVESEIEGEKLEDWEIMGFSIVLLVAGNETTTNLIGNMLNALAQRPQLWRQLREDRSLIDKVVEETLRYESPVQFLTRITKREVEISGVTIPDGAPVLVGYGSANRDPLIFSDPDEFRPLRDATNHVAFGSGIHYCLGAPLALAESRITLNALLDRFGSIERTDSPAVRQRGTFIIFGFRELPLRLS